MCAVIRRGILGGFSNKIGNIVGTSWKGIAVMKSLPLSVANPRTTGQVNTRTKFKTASQLGSVLLSNIIKPLWDRFAQEESGFNAFVKENFDACLADGTIDIDLLVTSKGKMTATPITSIVADASSNNVVITWGTALIDQYQLSTDLAYVATYDVDTNKWHFNTGVVLRSAGTITVSAPGQVVGNTVAGYLAFKRADGSVVSNSFGDGTTVQA